MSEDLNILDVLMEKDISKDVAKKMIEKIHSKMEEYSGNEDALAKLLQLKVDIYKKSPDSRANNLNTNVFRSPRRYILDEKNLPTLKMGNDHFNLDFNLANIANDIAKLKSGERIALGRNTLYGDQTGVVKHLNVFYDLGDGYQMCEPQISRRHCDICRNEAGQLELIDTSMFATRVLYSPAKKGLPASFTALEDEQKTQGIGKNDLPQEKTQVIDENNLPKLKLALVEFDLADIADKLKELESGKCIAIGREPQNGNQLNVAHHIQVGENDRTVSRRHCNIWRIDGKLVLEDCSLNGTTILPKTKETNIRTQDILAMKGKGR